MRMRDGSRHFGSLPETLSVGRADWGRLLEHLARLPGARTGDSTTDFVTEGWIDFELEGHRFSMNNQFGEWLFFVADATCDEEILRRVVAHFSELLGD